MNYAAYQLGTGQTFIAIGNTGIDAILGDKEASENLMAMVLAIMSPSKLAGLNKIEKPISKAEKGTTTKGSIIDGASDAGSTAEIKIEYKPEGTYINQTSHASGGSNLCGPTTCTMVIIDKKGNIVNLDSVVKQFDNIRQSGVNINEMSTVLSKNGVTNTPITAITANQLKDLATKNQSTIIGVSTGNQGHFIIVDSYKKVNGVGYYMIRDPYNGAMGVRADLLYSKMNGNGVILK